MLDAVSSVALTEPVPLLCVVGTSPAPLSSALNETVAAGEQVPVAMSAWHSSIPPTRHGMRFRSDGCELPSIRRHLRESKRKLERFRR
jgi:hypothetical protein